jgi:hypothetical protein
MNEYLNGNGDKTICPGCKDIITLCQILEEEVTTVSADTNEGKKSLWHSDCLNNLNGQREGLK